MYLRLLVERVEVTNALLSKSRPASMEILEYLEVVRVVFLQI